VKVIAKVNGQVSNTGTRTISDDGRTTTLEVSAFLPNAQTLPILFLFERRGEAP
jgi:hypothetical protein